MTLEIADLENSARRFTMLDALMLVVVAALVFSSNRAVLWLWEWRDRGTTYGPGLTRMMTWVIALSAPSFVLLPYQLVRPRDRSRLRRGAPGLLIHLVVVTVVAVQFAGWLSEAFSVLTLRGKLEFDSIRWGVEAIAFIFGQFRTHVVVGVSVSWMTLAILGRWNPEPAWDDRLGRFIGGLWIIFYLGIHFYVQ